MKRFYPNLKTWITVAALTASALSYAQEGSLTIEVKDITETDANVVITPSSDDLMYYWRVDSKADFEAKGGADKVVENCIAVWERDASWYDDTTWQEMMSYDMKTGVTDSYITDRFDPLTADTDYVIYAFGMDAAGNLTIPVTLKEFSNKSQETATLTIELKNQESTDAGVIITPSSDEFTYYWSMMTRYMFEKAGGATKIVENRIESWKNLAKTWDNTTWQEVMGWDLVTGATDMLLSDQFSLYPDNEYVIYAFGIDAEGNVTAPVVTETFSTIKAVPSENTFTLSIQSVTIDDTERANVKALVTPTNSDKYAVRMYEKKYVEQYDLEGGKDARKELINDCLLSARDSEIFSGEQTIQFTGRTANTDCYLFVVGLDENKAPSTDLYVLPFRTEATAPVQSITLEVTDITPMNAHFKITPSDEDMYYYIDIAPTSLVEEKGGIDIIPQQFIIDWWKFIADQYENVKWQDLVPLQCRKGTLDTTVEELVKEGKLSNQYWNSDWTLYAVGFSEDGEILTPTAVFNYTSPAPEKSDLTFRMELVSVDLDEASQRYTAQVAIYPSRTGEEFKAGYGTKSVFDAWVYNERYGLDEYIKSQWMDNAHSFTDAVILEMPDLRRLTYEKEPMYYKVIAMGWNEGPTTDPCIYDLNYDEADSISITPSEDTVIYGGEQKITISGKCSNVAVYSVSGQLMGLLRGAGEIEVPAGIYLVRYTQGSKTMTAKVGVR